MEYLLKECDMSKLFGICSTSEYSDYDSSIKSLPHFSPPIIKPISFIGTPDYTSDYESELASIFCYSCYDEGDNFVLKLKVDYIKHNTAVAFPSVLFVKRSFTSIPYTITSRNSPEKISGEIEVISYVD